MVLIRRVEGKKRVIYFYIRSKHDRMEAELHLKISSIEVVPNPLMHT